MIAKASRSLRVAKTLSAEKAWEKTAGKRNVQAGLYLGGRARAKRVGHERNAGHEGNYWVERQ